MAFPIAAVLLAIVAKIRGDSLRPAPGEFFAIALTGLLVVFGFNVLTTLGQMLTETSKAAIIAYTMPAMTAGKFGDALTSDSAIEGTGMLTVGA